MARSQRLDFMRTRALRMADMEAGGYVSPSEANDAINSAITECYDFLISVSPTEMYSSDVTLTTVAGTVQYLLPADFRSAVTVYALDGQTDGSRRPIEKVSSFDRAYYKAPTGVYSLVLEYIPAPQILTDDTDTFDGVSGYEELVIALAARNFLTKEESDITAVQQDISEMRQRIRNMFTRSKGPRYLLDVEAVSTSVIPSTVGVRGYRLRGASIELYESVIPLLVAP